MQLRLSSFMSSKLTDSYKLCLEAAEHLFYIIALPIQQLVFFYLLKTTSNLFM